MNSLLVASWNVNSLRARLDRLLPWLEDRKPDVVCLQELKMTADQFPFELLREKGYEAAVWGQKTYNGVAILARGQIDHVEHGFGSDIDYPEARLIAATVGGIRIVSVYVPNGGEVGSPKWIYKLQWLDQLAGYLQHNDLVSTPLLLCGDFNIAPEPRDVARPEEWEGSVLFHAELRQAFSGLLALGLVDTFRQHRQETGLYTWWDYRQLAFPRNNGLRIDHVLATPVLAARCTGVGIDRDTRKGLKPSDHAPVWAAFA